MASVDPASVRRAIGFYQQAVALDSGFVLAWVQLARARVEGIWWDVGPWTATCSTRDLREQAGAVEHDIESRAAQSAPVNVNLEGVTPFPGEDSARGAEDLG
jgi:hypothetical protein